MQRAGAPSSALCEPMGSLARDLAAGIAPATERLAVLELITDGGTAGCEQPLPDFEARVPYLLILQLTGYSVIRSPGTKRTLGTDDILLLNTSLQPRLSVFERSHQLCVQLPIQVTASPVQNRCLPSIGVLSGSGGIGVTLRSLMLAVRRVAPTLTAHEQLGVLTALLDLTFTAWAIPGIRPSREIHHQAPSRSLASVYDTIERMLSDPELNPTQVARAHGISIRQLHRLFRRTGTPFSEFVRRRRLEKCRDDLVDPRLHALRITEIAFRWGFSDSAHFSRCFRATFGASAREFRAQPLTASQIPSGRLPLNRELPGGDD